MHDFDAKSYGMKIVLTSVIKLDIINLMVLRSQFAELKGLGLKYGFYNK